MIMLRRLACILVLVLGSAACGSDPPPPVAPPPPAAPPPPPAAPSPAAKPAEAVKPTELTEKDFAEGPGNRDPFRSFLGEFNRPSRRIAVRQRHVILPRYGLDELRLIAVVTGGTRPRAMFRDPTGLGVSVKRGDYISKNAGKIKRILTDKVVVEIEEQAEDKNSLVDRVIDLHPKEEQERAAEEAAGTPQ